MQVDPAASLRCWAIEVEVAGRRFDIPAAPASAWLPVLLEGDLLQVLDMALSTEELDDLLLSGAILGGDLSEPLTHAVEAAAGRDLHAALVLAQVAKTHWGLISGQLARAGFDWDVRPLGAALDAIYAIVLAGLDKDGQAKFEALLDKPIVTAGRADPAARAKMADEFEALAGPKPTGGAVRSSDGPSGSGPPRSRPRLRPHPQAGP